MVCSLAKNKFNGCNIAPSKNQPAIAPLNIQNHDRFYKKSNSDRYSTPKIFYSSRALPIFEKFK
ncbi:MULTISPECIES: hypothetical protein [Pseudanabaena]|uniref:hypothetical protein n=1 Tax=Pseudanabaena TaxID=1152 RepID=UPI00247A6077|nr:MULTISPECIES: hypothetical protein [Pseudanabaena]MEA5489722.1 hypothetical protein [Pseudanabaena sp. CCNP1317]WGS73881.1 hypothetical protein OA858_07580 [Pseudanabaena galeata CCNP1313]